MYEYDVRVYDVRVYSYLYSYVIYVVDTGTYGYYKLRDEIHIE